MTDFLDAKRKEIDDRLKELRPLVDEYPRLEKAAAALAGVGGSGATGRRRSARPPGPPARRRRRPPRTPPGPASAPCRPRSW